MVYFNKSRKISTLPLNLVRHCCEDCTTFPNQITLHNHEVLEINTLLEGTLIMTVGDREYIMHPGDSVLINPFEFHSGKWQDCQSGCLLGYTLDLKKLLSFPSSNLYPAHLGLIDNNSRFDEFHEGDNPISAGIMKLESFFKKGNIASECASLAITYEILGELFALHYTESDEKQGTTKDIEFMKKVSRYVENNYNANITSADAAAALYMTHSTFCRRFKKNYGMSFSNYLCKFRINLASEASLDDSMSITELAASVGFSDYCYFSKAFKKHTGKSPAVYFKKWQK